MKVGRESYPLRDCIAKPIYLSRLRIYPKTIASQLHVLVECIVSFIIREVREVAPGRAQG